MDDVQNLNQESDRGGPLAAPRELTSHSKSGRRHRFLLPVLETTVMNDISKSPEVKYQGRWDSDHIAVWAGSSIRFRTSSHRITIVFGKASEGDVVWKVGENNVRSSRIWKDCELVLCEDSEGVGDRDVEILVKENGGRVEVEKLLIEELHSVQPPSLSDHPPLNVLVFGASQTSGHSPSSGYSNLAILPDGTYAAWPMVWCRHLRSKGHNVQTTLVARPGLRMVTTYDPVFTRGMDQLFWCGWDGLGGWKDQGSDGPHIVCCSIGSNDFASGTPADLFTNTFKSLLTFIREKTMSTLRHVVIVSPFGFFRQASSPHHRVAVFEPQVSNMVKSISSEWAAAGYEAKIWHVDTAGWVNGRYCRDGLHPNTAGHALIAEKLNQFIESNGILDGLP